MFQYSMMSWLNRQNSDEISFGELFYQLLEEVQGAALFNALEMMLFLFVEIFAEDFSLSIEKLNETVNKFIKNLPERTKIFMQSAA
ncbi:MAG: hypothetical protein RBR15_09930 [Sphaerochaeta sp.]|nr:hypothetical protein [Sphaerochaeta sp.]